METKLSNEEYLKWLKKETKDLDKTRKTYHLQSEWHRMMYAKMLEIETIERLINNN